MTRWHYKTETANAGTNTQKVRQLTAGERRKFAELSKLIKDGQLDAADLPRVIAKMGCVDPQLNDEDLEAMPADLLDACVAQIMTLSGFSNFSDGSEKKVS